MPRFLHSLSPMRMISILGLAIFLPVSLGASLAAAQEPEAAPTEPSGVIALTDALSVALRQNPGLRVYSWDIRAAEARAIQAALRPNPEIALQLEDVRLGSAGAGAGARTFSVSPTDGPAVGISKGAESSNASLLGNTQITLSLSQLIELGGKRAKRVVAANREREVAVWDYEVARADVMAQTASAFYAVLAAQERAKLADELLGLANQAHQTVQTLVQVGEVSGIEELRSQVGLSELVIERDSALGALNAARIELAGQWGSSKPIFDAVQGTFPAAFSPPAPEALQAALEQSPYLTRWQAELELRDAVLSLQKANARPDVTVSLGLRTAGASGNSFNGREFSTSDGIAITRGGGGSDRETRVVLGVSVPLPVFNRNQGGIKEAEYLIQRTADRQKASRHAIQNALAAGYQRAATLYEAIETLNIAVIPVAQEGFFAVQEGYRHGKFALLDVLIAQRTLFDAQRRKVEAQAKFQQEVVEIERFTGAPLTPEERQSAVNTAEEVE